MASLSGAACAGCASGCRANFAWAASAMQRALAAIRAIEMACYASLGGRVMLFFARRVESKTLPRLL